MRQEDDQVIEIDGSVSVQVAGTAWDGLEILGLNASESNPEAGHYSQERLRFHSFFGLNEAKLFRGLWPPKSVSPPVEETSCPGRNPINP
jgi:hypothetical protein